VNFGNGPFCEIAFAAPLQGIRYLSQPCGWCNNTDSTSVDHCRLEEIEMAMRISPLWWRVLAVASPVLVPMLLRRNRVFKDNRMKAKELNRSRINKAAKLALRSLEIREITVISDSQTREGFLGEPVPADCPLRRALLGLNGENEVNDL